MLFGGSAIAQSRLDIAPEYFNWQEESNGEQLLEESGFRIGLDWSYKQDKGQRWFWGSEVKAYYGLVDYDGHLQDGTPAKSETEYFGARLEGKFGYHYVDLGEKHSLDIIGGLGLDFWLRRLDAGGNHGYDEYWLPFYLKAGVEVCPNTEKGWIAALGFKLPLYTIEMADLDIITVTLHPKSYISAYAEAGYKFSRHLSVVAFFDSYRFARSDVATIFYGDQALTFWQPESEGYSVGAKLGWTF